MALRLANLKPAAPGRIHLLLAAGTWTVVGAMLLTMGTRWLIQSGGKWWPVLLAAAVAAGIGKAILVLGPAAGRIKDRIRVRGDGRCLGGFLSVRTWLLVMLMMAAGWALRTSHLPRLLLGLAYAAIGSALLLASRHLWLGWRDSAIKPG